MRITVCGSDICCAVVCRSRKVNRGCCLRDCRSWTFCKQLSWCWCPAASGAGHREYLLLLQVDVYTAYHDRNRCFPETISGAFPVIQAGNWFPRSFHNRLHAFCAYIRCTLAAIWLAWCAHRSVSFCMTTKISPCVATDALVLPVPQTMVTAGSTSSTTSSL